MSAMIMKYRRYLAALACSSMYFFCTAATVWAQEPKGGAKTIEPSKPIIEWLIGLVFLVACVVAAFKNAKRSNVQ